MIKLNNIVKVFDVKGQPLTVLNDITVHVAKGEIYGVIGASGAGKSTLIRCVNLLERPTQGQVLVDDVDLLNLNESELVQARRQIGMIFQHFNLLHSRTVFENVALPLELSKTPKAQIQQKVDELLQLVGLADKKDVYPANLSGGQKQRVAIARALASDPKVLLCDEATSALDPATTQAILALLQEINQRLGITILLITHEMEVVKRICHRVAVLDKGKLIEQDTVGEIFSSPKTALAKEFIRSTFHVALPDDYMQRLHQQVIEKSYPILRLEFTGQSVDAPILSQLAKQFGVDFSILTSQIDYIDGVKFGILIVEMFGDEQLIQQSLSYLQQQNIKIEVLGYVE
ncbi:MULTISPECIES: methionine ABC transporter ATP-binding protein MetN [unclassified Acinetobacter]|uniref:methionine ABC transporter ATP-binding protein MetN n=1 Tax=unclassified Acinetobacter TaxID=196816 RepID=UPI0035B7C28B